MAITTPFPDLAARLGPLTLPEADGGSITFADLWADRPVVLAHLRHFG